ncbi:methyl-accepting chemotaxis protein [Paenibacillus methanolicus]|uniref:Methyl-accepting chemotaxis protein n=1 Tax=Paenibacillus methanolicus TaxID=582686 RepID=A0A5S5C1M6_9BACL|nr:methyl-accepting chemotaxis protein [Paenibacillus methanolicus]TYP71863.1 methyl-accepting chemotaxis protein [Paenibacillus methanolicus]
MKRINMKMKVGTKISLSFVVVIGLMGTMAYSAYDSSQNTEDQMILFANNRVQAVESVHEMKYGLERLQAIGMMAATAKDDSQAKQLMEERGEMFAWMGEQIETYKKYAIGDNEIELIGQIEETYKKLAEIAASGTSISVEDSMSHYKAYQEIIQQLDDENGTNTEAMLADAVASSDDGQVSTMVFGGIAVAVAIIVVLILTRNLIRPLRIVRDRMLEVGDGMLTSEPLQLKRADEFGELAEAADKMVANLRNIVLKTADYSSELAVAASMLSESAEGTNKSAAGIKDTIGQAAAGAEQQGHSAGETARAMEEMSLGVQRVAESAGDVSDKSTEAKQDAEQGQRSIVNAGDRMDAVIAATDHLSQLIKHLEERNDQIGSLVDQINNIARQTGVLALNAGIEAARAGEHGRGFAVVAGEVRQLAAQSQTAATSIVEVIGEIQQSTKAASEAMDKELGEVNEANRAVKLAGAQFAKIVKSVQEMGAQVEETLAVAEEMSASSQEVSASVNEQASIATQLSRSFKSVTDRAEAQVSSMTQISAYTQELTRIAKELQATVQRFQLK